MSKESPDQWWANNHDEDKDSSNLMEQFKAAQSGKMGREEELEKAKHALELAKIEAEAAKISGTSQTMTPSGAGGANTPLMASATSDPTSAQASNQAPNPDGSKPGIGTFGLWWLSGGEATAVIVVGTICMLLIGGLAVGAMNEEEFLPVKAQVTGSVDTDWIPIDASITGDGVDNGTGWFEDYVEIEHEHEDCYTDSYGDYVCDYWYTYEDEYTCYAEISLKWTVNGTNYTDWADSPWYTSGSPCFEEIKDHYPLNTNMAIEIMPNDPSTFQVFTLIHGESGTKWKESQLLSLTSGSFDTYYTCSFQPSFDYTVDGVSYSSSFTGWFSTSANGGDPCMDEVKQITGPGSSLSVWVNPENHNDVRSEDPGLPAAEALLCCLPVVVLMLVAMFLIVRFRNTPPGAYVTRSGYVHHHGGYHHGSDVVVINNHYGSDRRRWWHRRRHHWRRYRPSRPGRLPRRWARRARYRWWAHRAECCSR